MAKHVFISYSTRDAEFASRLELDLNAHGISTWRDTSGIPPGENWHRRIVQALDEAYAVVSVVTPSANASEWVEREGLRANQKKTPIFPVMPASCDIPFYMQEKQPIKLNPEQYHANIERLVALLRDLDTSPAAVETQYFAPGSYLGRMRIIELVYKLPLAAIYRVELGRKNYLCKVAPPEYQDHLKRESAILVEMAKREKNLTTYLSIYPDMTQQSNPYGKVARGEVTHFYFLSHDFRAPTLREVLSQNPQPWILHVAWFILEVAQTILFMTQVLKVAHLNTTPDTLAVKVSSDGVMHPILLDLGVGVREGDTLRPDLFSTDIWESGGIHPYFGIDLSYTPPEFVASQPPRNVYAKSEAYVVSVLLYEMLASMPAFLRSSDNFAELIEEIRKGHVKKLKREDVPKDVVEAVAHGMNPDPDKRISVAELGRVLQQAYGNPPPLRRNILGGLSDVFNRNT